MTSHPVPKALESVVASVDALVAAWCAADVAGEVVDASGAAPLVRLNAAVAEAKRVLDAAHAEVAARIARASRPELGRAGLARAQGFRTPEAMISAATGANPGSSRKLVKVGEATRARMSLTGQAAPARFAHVARALAAGSLSMDAADAIIAMLDGVAVRVAPARLDEAERVIIEQAAQPGTSLDDVRKLLQRAQAWLDPDGVEPREDELRDDRSVTVRHDPSGMVHVTAKLDPESAAPVVTALDAIVGMRFMGHGASRAGGSSAGGSHPGDSDNGDSGRVDYGRADSGHADSGHADHGQVESGHGGAGDARSGHGYVDGCSEGASSADASAADASAEHDGPRRPVPPELTPATAAQLRADALVSICRHILGCDDADAPTAGATVVVRVSLDDLRAGSGHGMIDGLETPVSITTVRRMAADSGVIPVVLGGAGEVLDLGRSRRRFSHAQKLAIAERDEGCAFCGAPPGMTQVHHIRWWLRDDGPTDLSNGILLCTRCHHRVHDDGWGIDIRGGGVWGEAWFVPPRHVDPERVPRPGYTARTRPRLAA